MFHDFYMYEHQKTCSQKFLKCVEKSLLGPFLKNILKSKQWWPLIRFETVFAIVIGGMAEFSKTVGVLFGFKNPNREAT